mgnify:CR=1 FL=1
MQTMDISVELTLTPLQDNYEELIINFIKNLKFHQNLKISVKIENLKQIESRKDKGHPRSAP